MPTSEIRILVAESDDFPESALRSLESRGTVDLGYPSDEPLALAFAEYDVIFTRLGFDVEQIELPTGSRCRVLAVPTTGLDHVDVSWCEAIGTRVVSLRGEHHFLKSIRATAELTVALTLAVLRKVGPAADSVRSGQWDRDSFRGSEIAHSSIGIVGVGRVGAMVADIFGAMGATVLGFDTRSGWSHQGVAQVSTLTELFSRSSVVSLHVPFSRGDRPVVTAHELSHLVPGSVIINTARGGVLDEHALLRALQTGTVGAAALDVLSGEPNIETNPLVQYARENENLVITPHIGGNTYESRTRAEEFIVVKALEALAASQ